MYSRADIRTLAYDNDVAFEVMEQALKDGFDPHTMVFVDDEAECMAMEAEAES